MRPQPSDLTAAGTAVQERPRPKVAYMMSRFPRLTETFVVNEIVAVAAAGADVEVYPLLREKTDVVQPAAQALVDRAHYEPFVSPAILGSMLRTLRRRPRAYLRAVYDILRGTWGSLNFFVGALGIIPKVTRMAELMEAQGITHVHCHFASHPALAGFLIQRLTGIPFSFTAHGSDLHVDRHFLAPKVAEAKFVVAISEANRRIILDDCGAAQNVEVVHCGVDLAAFATPEGPVTSDVDVLCVGTLHEVKGQTHLLKALELLQDEGLRLRCVLVGDGEDRGKLAKQIADAGLDVRLAGRVTSPEVAALMRDAEMVVVPSVPTSGGKREGIPVVVMEALAAGKALVASDLSGIPEIVRHEETGLLAPPGDARAIADAIRRLHDDAELRARLGAAGRAEVRESFNLHTNAATLVDLFRS